MIKKHNKHLNKSTTLSGLLRSIKKTEIVFLFATIVITSVAGMCFIKSTTHAEGLYPSVPSSTYIGLEDPASITGAKDSTPGVSTAASGDDCENADLSKDCKIVQDLTLLINVLSAAVGVVVVGVVIVGGIQYSTAADDPQKITQAKSRIYSALLALVVFMFAWTILQWLIPGGVLN